MQNFIDLLLILLIIFFVISGKRRGFTRTLLSFLSKLASVAAAFFVSNRYAVPFYDTFLKENVLNALESQIQLTSSSDASAQISAVLGSVPQSLTGLAEMLGINTNVIKSEIADFDFTGNAAAAVEESLAGPLVASLCRIVLFALTSFVLSMLLGIVVNLICKVVKLPILRTANSVLGALLGVVNGVVCVFIISYVCVIAASLLGNDVLNNMVYSSRIIELFTDASLFI